MRTLRWAVVGVGTAGRARARAILADPRSSLVAVWRGRHAPELGVPIAASFDEAVARAEAVAIASPSEAHPEQVKSALEAGRHVVVEYPMAGSPDEMLRLFALARDRGLVLHEEHIELLTGSAAALRAGIRPEDVRDVQIGFTSPGDPVPGALLAGRNVARVSRLVDVAGLVASIERIDARAGALDAELRLVSGAGARLSFRQGHGLQRSTTIVVHADVEWRSVDRATWRAGVPVSTNEPPGLFAADHALAMARILDGAPAPVDESRLAHVTRIVHQLQNGCNGALH